MLIDIIPSNRQYYQCEAPLNLFRIVACAILAATGAVAAGVLLALIARALLPTFGIGFLGAVACSVFAYAAIDFGGCWYPRAGICLSLAISITFFFSYFQYAMSLSLGPTLLTRIDVLPGYLIHRVETDVLTIHGNAPHAWGFLNESKLPYNPAVPTILFSGSLTWLRWLHFLAEWLAILIAPIAYSLKAARRAFCGTCDAWMKEKSANFDFSQRNLLCQALTSGDATLLANLKFVPAFGTLPELKVEDCGNGTCPGFLSLRVITCDGSQSKKVVKQHGSLERIRLSPDELKILNGLMALPLTRPSARPSAGIFLIGEQLPQHEWSSALSTGAEFIAGCIALSRIVIFVGCITLAILLHQLNPTTAAGWIFSCIGYALLAIGFFWSIADLLFHSPYTRYLRRRCARDIADRNGPFVDPSDPKSFFVDIRERQHWRTQRSIERGFLKVDLQHRAVLYEGVQSRFCVPVEAISDCRMETVNVGAGQHSIQLYAVVLNTIVPGGTCEKPLFVLRSNSLRPTERKQDAEKLLKELNALVALRSHPPA